MPPAPYPLGGEAARRRRGRAPARRLRHRGASRLAEAQLRWTEWNAPFDGIEMINPDTSWRVWVQQAQRLDVAGSRGSARQRLLAALLDYPFRPAETIAALTQPDAVAEPRGRDCAAAPPVVDRRRRCACEACPARRSGGQRVLAADSRLRAVVRALSVHVTPGPAVRRWTRGATPRPDARDPQPAIRVHRHRRLRVAAVVRVHRGQPLRHRARGRRAGRRRPATLHVRSNAPARSRRWYSRTRPAVVRQPSRE